MSRREIIKDLEQARRLINSAKRRLPFGADAIITLSMLSEVIEEQQVKVMKEDGLR